MDDYNKFLLVVNNMEEKASTTKWSYVFKAVSFLLGAGLIVVGVLDIFSFSITDPITIVLTIYYM